MPDLFQPTPHLAVHPVSLADAARWPAEEPDFALGCECADPALQIERWSQEVCDEVRTPASEPH